MRLLVNVLRFLLDVKCAHCHTGCAWMMPRSRTWWCRGHRERAQRVKRMWDQIGESVRKGGES